MNNLNILRLSSFCANIALRSHPDLANIGHVEDSFVAMQLTHCLALQLRLEWGFICQGFAPMVRCSGDEVNKAFKC